MVPLFNVHLSGAWQWDAERKREYANYLDYDNHLIAVKSVANRAKSADGQEDWRPPRREYHCQYAVDWVDIKGRWQLTATPSEAEALHECEEPVKLEITRVEQAELAIADEPTPVGAGTVPAGVGTEDGSDMSGGGDALLYDPRGPDLDCGDFETQAFFEAAGGPGTDRHRLDGDGVACSSLR